MVILDTSSENKYNITVLHTQSAIVCKTVISKHLPLRTLN